MLNKILLFFLSLTFYHHFSFCQQPDLYNKISEQINWDYPYYKSLYRHLHQFPELSYQEKATSERIAMELRTIGLEVTDHFGSYGVVGLIKNGEGSTVLVRADMDALPILEKTGLPYASKVKAINQNGLEVDVMHACGHDIHMTVFIGVAKTLIKFKNKWQGTVVIVAQPAEETGGGAKTMLKEGLYTKFPKPDYCLALHVSPELKSGKVGYCPGTALASVDAIDITVYGEGGHGAYPHKTIDPIVLASRIVLALQTIVSREISPLNPAVVTVGAINGGFKHNVIPDEVKLQLTIRSYADEVRTQTIESIKRITRGIAISAGLPEEKYPEVLLSEEYTPSTINDEQLTGSVAKVFVDALGKENVLRVDPVMAGEDFSQYGRTKDNIPICIFWLGTVDSQKMKESKEKGKALPPLHSPFFAPKPEKTIKTGIKAMTSAVINLLNNKEGSSEK